MSRVGWASRPPVSASRDHELRKDRFGKMPKPAGETPTLPGDGPALPSSAFPLVKARQLWKFARLFP